ncbi:PA domain-containing protein [Paraglaciecola sp. 25GB23A]|uniref:PA domain-containing protein n=1 Tax=Paraglaciecola sp. 25GB23A TaxID=3156068 RepID=UPI0032AF3788
MNKKIIAAAVAATVMVMPAFGANLVLNNVDVPGIGFNDPTPATPVGGNMGTTVGEQRLIAYRRALDLWGNTLASDATIVVRGSFARLNCTTTGGTLAQAGALQIFADFPDAPLEGHWYGAALANSIAGFDLDPSNDDIVANFNGDVGKDDCIAGPGWYYGLDNNAPAGQTDFLDTFMHEVSHGLGFQNFANEVTGATPANLPDVYMANTYDLSYGYPWNFDFGDVSISQLLVRLSAVNNGNVVWTGPEVTANAPLVLGAYQGIRVTGSLNQELVFGTASFGAPATADNFGGSIAIGQDGVGASGDGCEALSNLDEVAGNVVMLDRGACAFTVKAANAQAAGASGVIIANNQTTGAIGLGGSDPAVTVPTISVSLNDGNAIKAASPGVSVEFFTDPTRQAGTNQGFVRLYAPTQVALGSSISHFDTVASPNLLMEPFINSDLRSATNLDLTPSLMQDVGWKIETLKIAGCDTGVPSVLPNGDMLPVQVEACEAGAQNHGNFVSCMTKVTKAAKKAGFITGKQAGAITSCAAR